MHRVLFPLGLPGCVRDNHSSAKRRVDDYLTRTRTELDHGHADLQLTSLPLSYTSVDCVPACI